MIVQAATQCLTDSEPVSDHRWCESTRELGRERCLRIMELSFCDCEGIELFRFIGALKSKREVAKVEPWKQKRKRKPTNLNACLEMGLNLTLEKPLHPQALEGNRGEALEVNPWKPELRCQH